MSCCCTEDNRIIIIKKNDTDFNNGNLVEFNITSDIYNVADFTAELILGDIKREFNDLSYGIINFNLSKEETVTLPYGNIDGVMNFIDSQGRVATISSIIPFRVIGIVENDAIKTSDVDYTINVEQGGKNIFNIDVKTNVSVRVGTVETLPSGSSAYVENVGTPTGVVLNFGIPQGIQGEQGIRGEQGIQGEKGDKGDTGATGQAATIAVGTVATLQPNQSAYVTNAGTSSEAVFNFGIPKGEKGDTGSQGEQGEKGETGEAATIQVGTVTTLSPSQPAYVQNVGTEQNAIFNFGIPKGDSGSGEGSNADFSNITGSPYDCDALAIALNEKQNVIEDLLDIRSGAELGSTAVQPSSLATVATSGSYNDLSDKPTIPSAQVNSDWNASSGVAQILNKPTLSTVATSGSYNDLSNKPIIPQALSDIAVAGDNITFTEQSYKDITVTGSVALNNGIASNFTASNYIDFKDSTRYTTGTTTYYLKSKTPSSGAIQGCVLQWNRWANLEFLSGSGLNAWNWGSNSSVNLLADSQVQSDTEYYFKIDVDYENKTKTYSYSLDGIAYTQLASFTDTGMDTSYSNPLRLGNSSYSPSSDSAFTGSIDLGGCYVERSGVEICRGYYANAKVQINASVPTVDQTYNSASANPQSGVAINGAGFLKNSATGSKAICIFGNASGSYSVAIGSHANATQNNCVAIGNYSGATGYTSVAVGMCQATANYAIQLGTGTNSTANTFSVGLSNSLNVRLLNSDGTIPYERLPIATSVDSTSTNSQVVGAKLFYDTCGNITDLINAL